MRKDVEVSVVLPADLVSQLIDEWEIGNSDSHSTIMTSSPMENCCCGICRIVTLIQEGVYDNASAKH